VDEAQEFSANMIRAMLAHLAPDHSVTLCSMPPAGKALSIRARRGPDGIDAGE
jgi:hypothetical protein